MSSEMNSELVNWLIVHSSLCSESQISNLKFQIGRLLAEAEKDRPL